MYKITSELEAISQPINIEKLQELLIQYNEKIPWDEVRKKLGVEVNIQQLQGFLQAKGIHIPIEAIKSRVIENQDQLLSTFTRWGKLLTPGFRFYWAKPGLSNKVKAVGYLALYLLTLLGIASVYMFVSS